MEQIFGRRRNSRALPTELNGQSWRESFPSYCYGPSINKVLSPASVPNGPSLLEITFQNWGSTVENLRHANKPAPAWRLGRITCVSTRKKNCLYPFRLDMWETCKFFKERTDGTFVRPSRKFLKAANLFVFFPLGKKSWKTTRPIRSLLLNLWVIPKCEDIQNFEKNLNGKHWKKLKNTNGKLLIIVHHKVPILHYC